MSSIMNCNTYSGAEGEFNHLLCDSEIASKQRLSTYGDYHDGNYQKTIQEEIQSKLAAEMKKSVVTQTQSKNKKH